jgi:hypothetical protein
MPAYAGIHVLLPSSGEEDVDGRDRPGHDGKRRVIVSRMFQSRLREAFSSIPDCLVRSLSTASTSASVTPRARSTTRR